MLKLTYVISENEHYVGLVSFRRSERRHAQGEEQRQIASRTHVHNQDSVVHENKWFIRIREGSLCHCYSVKFVHAQNIVSLARPPRYETEGPASETTTHSAHLVPGSPPARTQ